MAPDCYVTIPNEMNHISKPRRVRVLFLIPSLVAHGAERQLYELVRHMDQERFELHVAVFYGPGETEDGDLWAELTAVPDVAVHWLRKRRGPLGYLTAMPRLLALISWLEPALVHGYMDGNLPVLLAGKLLRRRVAWGIRRTSRDLSKLDRLSRFLLEVLLRLAPFTDLIIFNSEAGRSHHIAMGMTGTRLEVVANGFDVGRFQPEPGRGARLRAAWGIPAEAPLIGLVGRLNPVKDHPTFLRAAASLAGQWPEARFVCVGGGPAPYRARLVALAGELGLGPDRLLMPGACPDMPAVYSALTALVLASTDEGFPNVLGEAMACGVPCVTTRVGDAAILVGPWGRVVAPGDAPGIAAALAGLLREAPAARAARAEGCRGHISANFSVEALARNTERIILSLIETPLAPAPADLPLEGP